MDICNRDCSHCKHLSANIYDNYVPVYYECLKYGDSVLKEKFKETKHFWEIEDLIV